MKKQKDYIKKKFGNLDVMCNSYFEKNKFKKNLLKNYFHIL